MRETSKKKNYYRYIIMLLVVFLFASTLFFLDLWERNQGNQLSFKVEDSVIRHNGEEYTLNENIETFLVMGLDKFGENLSEESTQSDFLMLFIFDNEEETCSAIQINRDTMTDINVLGVTGNKIDTVNRQIALAYAYGNTEKISCRNTVDAVSDLLFGVEIDHYLSLKMDAVPILNDAVGGVEVEVLEDFSAVDPTLIKGEKVTLKGEQALTYIRSRKDVGDNTNQSRMERQRQYISAFQKKANLLQQSDEEFTFDLATELSEYIVSDRSVTQLEAIAEKLLNYDFSNIKQIEGETKIGEFVEFYPNENLLKETVLELFYNKK